jgi:hypothetical protein
VVPKPLPSGWAKSPAKAFRHAGIPDLPEGKELADTVEEVRASLAWQRGVEAVPDGPESAAGTSPKRARRSRPIKAGQGG